MSELLSAACDIARAAGSLLRDAFGRAPSVSHKGMIDLVTDADRASEALIVKELAARFPDHDVLAEESGAHAAAGRFRWVIDPLDGTTNFAHGVPHFAVLLALEERQGAGFATRLGVTYDPMRDELFVAERGQGATLNGAPIRVSSTGRLLDALLSTGFGYERLVSGLDNHAEFCRLSLLSQGVRRLGAAGLDIAYLACGRLDGFWEYELKWWDICGGLLLVSEAGGQASKIDGAAIAGPLGRGEMVVAANPGLHGALLAALVSARGVPVNSRQGLGEHLPADVARDLVGRGVL